MTATVTAVNQTQSLAAVRNFVRASVSYITYARGLCSENAYEQRPFLGLPLRQLIPSTVESVTISEWIEKGAFDALNRSYLKEMSLCVYNADCSALLESYCFGFNYSADGQRAQMSLSASQQHTDRHVTMTPQLSERPAMSVPAYRKRRCSKQEVQRMLTKILERLLDVVGSLPPLLSKRVLTMRLTYYDEVTPATYEPPCFAPASRHMLQLYQEEVQHHVHIGSMDTSHHLFSVAIRHPLLQQIQSQISDPTSQMASSAPLQSGLESTFSSEAVKEHASLLLRSAEAPHHAVQENAASQKRTCPTSPNTFAESGSEDVGGAATATLHAREDNEKAAAGETITTTDTGQATNPRRSDGSVLRAGDVSTLDALTHLINGTAANHDKEKQTPQRALKASEQVYVLFAAFVFSHAPGVRGGRGRLTPQDAEAYRTQSCPFDVSAATVRLMLERLSAQGFLSPSVGDEASPFRRVRRDSPGRHDQNRHRGASGTVVTEWTVSDPPLPLLHSLLRLDAVVRLLTHPCHVALQELSVYLEREQNRVSARGMSHRVSVGQKRSRDAA